MKEKKMFENKFARKPVPKQKSECKIKIKNTPNGKTITFQGNCSKEQLEMAKIVTGADGVEEEE
jgi:uncharacterized protein (DUF1919 family)